MDTGTDMDTDNDTDTDTETETLSATFWKPVSQEDLFWPRQKPTPKWVVQKLLNVNPGLNVNWSISFSCFKMFLTSFIWCSLRLLQLKTETQAI